MVMMMYHAHLDYFQLCFFSSVTEPHLLSQFTTIIVVGHNDDGDSDDDDDRDDNYDHD